MAKYGIGQPVARLEDPRLLRGQGRFINDVNIAFSNSNPTAPYRGAGRPEATYVTERLIDTAAARLGIDRVDLRRRNLIPESAMPYDNPFGINYDFGAFERGMDGALALSDRHGYAARGKLRGVGIVNAIERAASPGLESRKSASTPAARPWC